MMHRNERSRYVDCVVVYENTFNNPLQILKTRHRTPRSAIFERFLIFDWVIYVQFLLLLWLCISTTP